MNTILVCDDERDIVSAIRIYLNGEGYRVLEAYSGVQALELMARERVDLVLMDIMMPEMDGLTAVAKIRETSNVPVLFLSAKSEDTDKILGLNIGADDYITKPFNPVELCARSTAFCACIGRPRARCSPRTIFIRRSGMTRPTAPTPLWRCISAICGKSWRSTRPTPAI